MVSSGAAMQGNRVLRGEHRYIAENRVSGPKRSFGPDTLFSGKVPTITLEDAIAQAHPPVHPVGADLCVGPGRTHRSAPTIHEPTLASRRGPPTPAPPPGACVSALGTRGPPPSIKPPGNRYTME